MDEARRRRQFVGLRKPPGADFPTLLHEGLVRRGLSLTRARELLAQRGEAVSLATLSYWRSGQRLPEGPASLDVLDCLDEILGLAPGTLRTSLGPSRRQPPGTEEYVDVVDMVRPSLAARRALADLGLELTASTYVEEYVMAAVDVDHRGQEVACTTRTRIRALQDGVDRTPLVIDAGAPLDEPVSVLGVWGCTVTDSRVSLEEGLIVYELTLERALRRGETATFEYSVALADLAEPETEFFWHLPHRTPETEVWVRFDPALLPRSAEVFTRLPDGEETASAVDVTDSTSLVSGARQFGPGTVGVRWSWE